MIKLPKMTLQDMYDYETYYHLSMRPERMAKFAVHYEAFKMIKNVPGSIVECGVFKGTSFVRFAMLRELFENNYSAKLVGFDVFSDKFPV